MKVNEILDNIKNEIGMYECNCNLAVSDPVCRKCGDNVFGSVYQIIDKHSEGMETITVSKGCLKARIGRFVVYDVDYLRKHIEQELKLYGEVKDDKA